MYGGWTHCHGMAFFPLLSRLLYFFSSHDFDRISRALPPSRLHALNHQNKLYKSACRFLSAVDLCIVIRLTHASWFNLQTSGFWSSFIWCVPNSIIRTLSDPLLAKDCSEPVNLQRCQLSEHQALSILGKHTSNDPRTVTSLSEAPPDWLQSTDYYVGMFLNTRTALPWSPMQVNFCRLPVSLSH